MKTARRISISAVIIIGLAVLFRIIGAWLYRNDMNADYAIVVTMVQNMAAFKEFPVFFYGQAYMGSLEPLLSVPFVWIFGFSGFAVCMGTALCGIFLSLAIWDSAKKAGGVGAAILAVILSLIGPYEYFRYLASPRGGYALCLFLTVWLLLLAVRIALGTSVKENQKTILLLGFAGGLGFWNFWLTLPALVTACLLLLLHKKFELFKNYYIAIGAGGFAVGSLPFWLWNACNHWVSFDIGSEKSRLSIKTIINAFAELFYSRIPHLFADGNRYVSAGNTSFIIFAVILSACIISTIAILWKERHNRQSFLFATVSFVSLFVLVFGAIYSLSNFHKSFAPRYLLPLVPVTIILFSIETVYWFSKIPAVNCLPLKSRILATPVLVCYGSVFICFLLSIPQHLKQFAAGTEWKNTSATFADELEQLKINTLAGNFWDGGLRWITGGRIHVDSPVFERIISNRQELELADSPAVLSSSSIQIENFIRDSGARCDQKEICRHKVFYNIKPPENNVKELPVDAISSITLSGRKDILEEMTDQRDDTAVSVLIRPRSEAAIDITFRQPVQICGLRLWIENQRSFREMAIDICSNNDGVFTAVSPWQNDPWLFWSGSRWYYGGIMCRTERRFDATSATAIKLRFKTGSAPHKARIKDLQILSPAQPSLPINPSEIVKTIEMINPSRIYADRWLGNELRKLISPRIPISGEPEIFNKSDLSEQKIPLKEKSLIIAEPQSRYSIQRGLELSGKTFEKIEENGVTFFILSPCENAFESSFDALHYGATIQLLPVTK